MASDHLPIPLPPRTPTPPPDDPPARDDAATAAALPSYDPNTLSPMVDTFPHLGGAADSGGASTLNPADSTSIDTPAQMQNSSSGDGAGPFNFKPMVLAKGPVVKSVRETSIFLNCYSSYGADNS